MTVIILILDINTIFVGMYSILRVLGLGIEDSDTQQAWICHQSIHDTTLDKQPSISVLCLFEYIKLELVNIS